MIKLDGSTVVATTSPELDTLQTVLSASYPELVYAVVDNRDANFPFKLTIDLDMSTPDVPVPAMDVFFKFLLKKIDEANQPV